MEILKKKNSLTFLEPFQKAEDEPSLIHLSGAIFAHEVQEVKHNLIDGVMNIILVYASYAFLP